MQQLIYFLQKYKYFLYFLFLQAIGFSLIIYNNNFHKSKFINSTNFLIGSYYNTETELSDYFNLRKQNKILIEENEKLKNKLEKLNHFSSNKTPLLTEKDSIISTQFEYIKGKIIKNEYHHLSNYLTAKSGKRNGIEKEMAVINANGIIGITDDITNNYTRIRSILNEKTKINARFKNNFYFGTLEWNGKEYQTMQLTDIPRQAVFKIGDTIITGGKSAIFPEGIPIGTILNKPEKASASNTLDVRLFNDMSNIKYIYFIKNNHKQEIKGLENGPEEQ